MQRGAVEEKGEAFSDASLFRLEDPEARQHFFSNEGLFYPGWAWYIQFQTFAGGNLFLLSYFFPEVFLYVIQKRDIL